MIEKAELTIGIIPLTDCAPIAVAVEHGYFADEGLNVTTSREQSWASIRDKLAFGVFDAAHLIAPMALSTTLGIGGVQRHVIAPVSLGLNGNAITVSNELFDLMSASDPQAMARPETTGRALRSVIAQRRADGMEPLTFGMVFPISTHNYELRYWMAAAGIDPDHDVNLVVVPPPRMVDALKEGRIAGFCVGEPWNALTVNDGIGKVLITKHRLWNNSPEKVLGVTRDWAEQHPETLAAMIRGLVRAGMWLDDPEHHAEAAALLAQPQYVGVDAAVIEQTLGAFVFHGYAAQFPWRSHAVWFLTQMLRWGQVQRPLELDRAAESVYRGDLYREAVGSLGVSSPLEDTKAEGTHAEAWSTPGLPDPIELGPDLMLDGREFDPTDPMAYLEASKPRQMAVSMKALSDLNAPG